MCYNLCHGMSESAEIWNVGKLAVQALALNDNSH
jgi:hypothetical protein